MVEEEIDRVLQALEEMSPKPQKTGSKLQMVAGEGSATSEEKQDAEEEPFYDEWYGGYIMIVKRPNEGAESDEGPAKRMRESPKGGDTFKGKGKGKGPETRN